MSPKAVQSGLLPEAMLVFKGHTATGSIPNCAASQGHGDIWTQAAAEGHVWVHDPTTVVMSLAHVITRAHGRVAPSQQPQQESSPPPELAPVTWAPEATGEGALHEKKLIPSPTMSEGELALTLTSGRHSQCRPALINSATTPPTSRALS